MAASRICGAHDAGRQQEVPSQPGVHERRRDTSLESGSRSGSLRTRTSTVVGPELGGTGQQQLLGGFVVTQAVVAVHTALNVRCPSGAVCLGPATAGGCIVLVSRARFGVVWSRRRCRSCCGGTPCPPTSRPGRRSSNASGDAGRFARDGGAARRRIGQMGRAITTGTRSRRGWGS